MQQPPDFIPPDQPSPTSKYGVNVRYYHITTPTGQDVYWDYGATCELLLEELFKKLPEGKLPSETDVQMLRGAMEECLLHGVNFMPTTMVYSLEFDQPDVYTEVMEFHQRVVDKMDGFVTDRLIKLVGNKPTLINFESW